MGQRFAIAKDDIFSFVRCIHPFGRHQHDVLNIWDNLLMQARPLLCILQSIHLCIVMTQAHAHTFAKMAKQCTPQKCGINSAIMHNALEKIENFWG